MASTNNTMHLAVAAVMDHLQRRDYAGALNRIDAELANGDVSAGPRDRDLLLAFSGECLAVLGRSEDALSRMLPLISKYRPSDAHEHYALACIGASAAYYFKGDLNAAEALITEALHAAHRIDNHQLVAKSHNWAGNVSFYRGDYPTAASRYRDCLDVSDKHALTGWTSVAGLNLGLTYILTGSVVEARKVLRAATEQARSDNDLLNSLRCGLVRAYAELCANNLADARRMLEALRSDAQSTGHIREQCAWFEYMGELEMHEGNLRAARQSLRSAIALASGDSRDESVIGQSRRLLAQTLIVEGKWTEAIEEANGALEPVRKVGERIEEGIVQRVIGEAKMNLASPADARAALKGSIDILRRIGARLEWAKSLLVAGRCDGFSQRERLAYLMEAERLFAEIGVNHWIDQTRELLNRLLPGRAEEIATVAAREPATHVNSLFVTADPDTIDTVRLAERLARSEIAILLTGETGVGKDQLSRLVHAASPRHNKPFLALDLSTLPESLWESSVFGHCKGTFTGATSDKIGLLESANGGTVFLNEIGNLSMQFQAKLLELLDSKSIRRIGDTALRPLDIRFIAATNADLRDAVACGRFRSDLYYRLAQAPLHLKPLRERRADIVPLLRNFLTEFGVPVGDLELLDHQLWVERAYNGHWAGNVRQLRSFVHRLVAIAGWPSEPDFPMWAERLLEQIDIIHEPNVGARISREGLISSLERNYWNQRATARDLGITEGGVRHVMRRYGIKRPQAA